MALVWMGSTLLLAYSPCRTAASSVVARTAQRQEAASFAVAASAGPLRRLASCGTAFARPGPPGAAASFAASRSICGQASPKTAPRLGMPLPGTAAWLMPGAGARARVRWAMSGAGNEGKGEPWGPSLELAGIQKLTIPQANSHLKCAARRFIHRARRSLLTCCFRRCPRHLTPPTALTGQEGAQAARRTGLRQGARAPRAPRRGAGRRPCEPPGERGHEAHGAARSPRAWCPSPAALPPHS